MTARNDGQPKRPPSTKGRPKPDASQRLINERNAIQLKIAGHNHERISETLTWTDSTGREWPAYANGSSAARAIRRALKRDISYDAAILRDEQLARIDAAMKAIWPDVVRGKLVTIDRMLALQKQMAAYVPDLAEPEKVDVGDNLLNLIYPPLAPPRPVAEDELKGDAK